MADARPKAAKSTPQRDKRLRATPPEYSHRDQATSCRQSLYRPGQDALSGGAEGLLSGGRGIRLVDVSEQTVPRSAIPAPEPGLTAEAIVARARALIPMTLEMVPQGTDGPAKPFSCCYPSRQGPAPKIGCTYRRYSPLCTPNHSATAAFLLLSGRALDQGAPRGKALGRPPSRPHPAAHLPHVANPNKTP